LRILRDIAQESVHRLCVFEEIVERKLARAYRETRLARAIVFLLDPENAWITGQVLAVDGGLSRVRPKMKA
jgi:NAD(P)-dependent dehydrogenase (short-subunit alcohol dehydrogenase family)